MKKLETNRLIWRGCATLGLLIAYQLAMAIVMSQFVALAAPILVTLAFLTMIGCVWLPFAHRFLRKGEMGFRE